MIRKISLFLLSIPFIATGLSGQSFQLSFDPGTVYTATANLEEYNIYQIDFFNEMDDSLQLSWRLVGNTMPEEWEVTLCDNTNCYGILPTGAPMNPFAPGDYAFLKLDVNPGTHEGVGQLDFWIYPTDGIVDDHVAVSFVIQAGEVTSIQQQSAATVRAYPNPTDGPLQIDAADQADLRWSLFDLSGKPLIQGQGTHTLSLSHLAEGPYLLRLQTDRWTDCRLIQVVKSR